MGHIEGQIEYLRGRKEEVEGLMERFLKSNEASTAVATKLINRDSGSGSKERMSERDWHGELMQKINKNCEQFSDFHA